MNKQELAKEIELQEERLLQLKKEYAEKNKSDPKIGKCFILNYIYYKIVDIDNNRIKPIKAIRVIKNRTIEVVDLYLENYDPYETISNEKFNELYLETLKTISNYYEQD